MTSLSEAYSATGQAWQAGPGKVYDRLADELAARCPVRLEGARVLDLGAGTGAGSRAAQRRGAEVVAVDVAVGMLEVDADARPPAAVGDALGLPFAGGAFDVVLAAFSLNHLADPVAGLREAARVLRPGGGLVVATYASDDDHPVKRATEAAAAARGWRREPWYEALQTEIVPRLATLERAAGVASAAGLTGADVANVRVPFPRLGPHDLVAWRLGMAHLAPFVGHLPPSEQVALAADAVARLGPGAPALVSSLVLLAWRRPE
ncbi:MAG TPA: methyltransferase domain-containing protein [Acidimicrobiales bacterium]|nr:methyltransferase domain-containing protein [Acidimicrobiales bacterium]